MGVPPRLKDALWWVCRHGDWWVCRHVFLSRIGGCAATPGIALDHFRRENTVRLTAGEESLYPDGAFALATPAGTFTFFVELDNRTETVRATSSLDSWGRKVQFYERYQDAQAERFRVLAITTGGPERLRHMLECAAEVARNPRRSLVYGIRYADFLDIGEPLESACFRNHHEQSVALVPSCPVINEKSELTASAMVVASAPCLRSLAEV